MTAGSVCCHRPPLPPESFAAPGRGEHRSSETRFPHRTSKIPSVGGGATTPRSTVVGSLSCLPCGPTILSAKPMWFCVKITGPSRGRPLQGLPKMTTKSIRPIHRVDAFIFQARNHGCYLRNPLARAIRCFICSSLRPRTASSNSRSRAGSSASISKNSLGVTPR